MSYVAAVCGKGAEVNQVKEQLLQSNPVLEGKEVVTNTGVCTSLVVTHLLNTQLKALNSSYWV